MSTVAKAQAVTDVHQKAADDKVSLGFWLYIMTDCVLFASLFATFAVLRGNTAGGEAGDSLFSLPFVLIETLILLTSSFTCGLALLAAKQKQRQLALLWFGLTAVLGLCFIGMELHEFSSLVNEGNSWRQSGFLSAYFALVATHGLHITIGLLWMIVMMVRMRRQSITPQKLRQLTLLSVFWHFLDVIWIFIFTIVYLVGAI